MELTENEVAVLLEASGKTRLSEKELAVFSTLDSFGGMIRLSVAEKRILRKVARTLESYELNKYHVSKAKLLRKLKK